MKKAWRTETRYGLCYIVCYSENGKLLDIYKEYDEKWREERAKGFSFKEWMELVPQSICGELNKELRAKNEYTDYINFIKL